MPYLSRRSDGNASDSSRRRSRLFVEALEDRDVPATFVDLNVDLPQVRAGDMQAADYDNDGHVDLAIAGEIGPDTRIARIYRNNGNGTFSDSEISLTPTYSPSLNWVDYDNDGWMDLSITEAIANTWGGATAKIYHNNQDGSFSEIISPLPQLPGNIAWGDYDNDGLEDIAFCTSVPNYYGYAVSLYHNDGDGVFTKIATELRADGFGLAWVDFDNDERLDLAVNGSFFDKTTIYRNSADGVFEATGIELPMFQYFEGTMAWSDYDGDNYPDVLIAGYNDEIQQFATLLHNNGDGTFSDSGLDLPDLRYGGEAAWGDIDNDGDSDLVVTGATGKFEVNELYTNIYRNDSGVMTLLTSIRGVRDAAVAWGEFDNDGYLDLALSGTADSAFASSGDPNPLNTSQRISAVYRNEPDTQFIRGTLYPDFNGDGIKDRRNTDGPGNTVFPGLNVYLDANNNGMWDTGETTGVVDANSKYSLFVTPGEHTVRILEDDARAAWPKGGYQKVTVGDTDAVQVDFGMVPASLLGPIYSPYQFERQSNGETQEQAILRALYATLLDRIVDVTSEFIWTQRLQAGMSIEELTQQIVRSEEYAFKEVNNYYRALLGRSSAGDPGANTWLLMIQRGADGRSIVPYIIGSEEYRGRSQSQEEFVDSVYVTVLGREVDNSGQTGWLSSLSLTGSYYDVAKGVALSRESCEQIVRSFYSVYLNREAETIEWVDLLFEQKITVTELRTAFLASSEFLEMVTG